MGGDLFSQFGEPANELEGPESSPDVRPSGLPLVRNTAGRRSAFDEARLRASIERAQKAAGESVSTLAAEVADIVRFTLSSHLGRRPGSSEGGGGSSAEESLHVDEVGALVERALIEVGATGTARSYIVARDRRLRARDLGLKPEDVFGNGSGAAANARLPSVRGATGAEPFQGHRVVAALIEEAGLLPAQAEEVAAGVESTLAGAKMRVVSTGLVRELVNSELLARGLGEALRRHESVGIPRHDLDQLFRSATSEPVEGAGEARPFEQSACGTLLRRWVLGDALPAAVGEAHRRGDLFVGGLEALHRVRMRAVPSSLLLKGRGHSAFAALERVARLARDTSDGLVIEDLVPLSKSLIGSAAVESFALAMGGLGLASGRSIDLAATGGAPGAPALFEFLNAMSPSLAEGAALPRIFASLEGVAGAVALGAGDAAEVLLWSGHLVPVWTRGAGGWAGVDRSATERGSVAIGASVGINLPRLARRAGPWREDVFLSEASSAVERAVEAMGAVAEYQARARSLHGVAASDCISHTLLPVGLLDALRILGDGVARADQGSRVLGFLGEAAERIGHAKGVDARLGVGCTTRDAERAALWFAACDARLGGPGQPRLFSDLPRPEEDRPRAYRAGVGELTAQEDPLRIRERAEALGSLLCTVPVGALVPEPGPRRGGPVDAARAGDFLELLARAPRAVLAPLKGGEHSGGGGGADSSTKNLADRQLHALEESRGRWPRLAAWARFAQIRAGATVLDAPLTETTLF